MSATTATLAGREAAEGRMTDTCQITKPGEGEPVFDDASGKYVAPAPVEVYGPATAPHFGKCRIPRRAGVLTSGAASQAGEVGWEIGEWPLDLPVGGTEALSPSMVVNYLTAELDASLPGRTYTLVEPARQSQSTARRFKMKEGLGT